MSMGTPNPGRTTGLIHIYCGDGKGKTTAAVGLSVRMAGAGKRVVFSQFFKDGSSGELQCLNRLGIRVMNCKTVSKWFHLMNGEEREQVKADYGRFLEEVFTAAKQADLLVMDELFFACANGTLQEDRIVQLLEARPDGLEIVLTGRNPSARMIELADYVTEMNKRKHPYDSGVPARLGIEF